uniref:Glycine zipper domain-containing protein n=1 Tax=Corethron hystrix TaxID=216773 RepID=A0A7S1B2Z1_9STRA
MLGDLLGVVVGSKVGALVGWPLGSFVGDTVGRTVGNGVGSWVGSFEGKVDGSSVSGFPADFSQTRQDRGHASRAAEIRHLNGRFLRTQSQSLTLPLKGNLISISLQDCKSLR